MLPRPVFFFFFFFNDTATTEIYTLSLHDALPICMGMIEPEVGVIAQGYALYFTTVCILVVTDRKSTRLNSSHLVISYAVFCLKKKKKQHRRFRESSILSYMRYSQLENQCYRHTYN